MAYDESRYRGEPGSGGARLPLGGDPRTRPRSGPRPSVYTPGAYPVDPDDNAPPTESPLSPSPGRPAERRPARRRLRRPGAR